jgi:poly(beta-D-mannuronate) lyase
MGAIHADETTVGVADAGVRCPFARAGGGRVVKDPTQLKAAIAPARAGDVVVLSDGAWKDVDLHINQGSADGRPLVIRAKTPGQVTLGG